jgi:predicted neutral ceramidase superfamily lipid hydrolase
METTPLRGRRLLPATTTSIVSLSIILAEITLATAESDILLKSVKIASLFPLYIGLTLMSKAFSGRTPTVSTRRTLYLHAFFNTPIIVSMMLGITLINIMNGLLTQILFVLPLTLMAFLYGLVWLTIFGVRLRTALIFTALFSVVYLVTAPLRIPLARGALLAALPLISLSITSVTLLKIKAGDVSGLDLMAAFANSWMDRTSESFDAICQKIGKNGSVNISAHIFSKPCGEKIVAVVPYIHPGPARSIGSAELPSLLYERIKEFNPTVFHGATNHSLNLASRRETVRIVDSVRENLGKPMTFSKLNRIGMTQLERQGIRVSKYSFLTNSILFVSKNDNTEDLPAEITGLANKKTDIIDRHNGLCDEKTAIFNDAETDVVTKLIAEIDHLPTEEVEIDGLGYFRMPVARDDVGPGGVSALVFKGNKKFGFICIDSNNLACGLERVIQQAIKKMGFEQAEITTTDNHWNSGIGKTQLGYEPAGTTDNKRLVEDIIRATSEAEKRVSPVMYYRDYFTFSSTVLGEDGLFQLTRALNNGAKMVYLFMTLTILIATIIIIF